MAILGGDVKLIAPKLLKEITQGCRQEKGTLTSVSAVLEASANDDFQVSMDLYAKFPHFNSYPDYADEINSILG